MLVGWINAGEVLVADRGFCGWGLIALLGRKRVDVMMRLHQACGDKPGSRVWRRPQRPETWGVRLWRELPGELALCIVRFQIHQPGLRTSTITLATTLLDEEAYPDAALKELYLRRWQIEGNYRDIKTTLGLDVLRTRSPEMIEKEILMQAIAHSLVRAVMLEVAARHPVPLDRVSFKAALTAMRHWAPLLHESRQPQRRDARRNRRRPAADPPQPRRTARGQAQAQDLPAFDPPSPSHACIHFPEKK
jgi:IS4 transposase